MWISVKRHSSWRQALAIALAGACLLATSVVQARPGDNALRSQMAQGAGPGAASARVANDNANRPEPNVAPGEAARRAANEYGGRVLNVVLADGPGGPYYRVKLLDGGRVRVVHVDAHR